MTIWASILVAALTAVAVFLAVYVATRRLAHGLVPRPDTKASLPTTGRHSSGVWLQLVRRTTPWVPERLGGALQRRIVMAGGLEDLSPAEVVLLAVVGVVMGAALGSFLAIWADWSLWLAAGGGAVGVALPFVWLRDRVHDRHQRVLRDLPFYLDLLTLSVEAGLDFGAAVGRAVEKGRPGPLHEELKTFLAEVRVGKTRVESLQSMAERVGLPALTSFLGALIQTDRLGTSLGKTLRLQSDQIRRERFQRAEKSAAEAPVKMLLPLVLFLFPTIWIILAAPLAYEWLFRGMP